MRRSTASPLLPCEPLRDDDRVNAVHRRAKRLIGSTFLRIVFRPTQPERNKTLKLNRKIRTALMLSTALVAGIALAKEGVKDPQVKAREELMDTIAANTKTLGEMAGGKVPFDATSAAAAKAALAAAAAKIPAMFEPQATDPVSEAKAEIWANWADFVTKSEALLTAAEAVDTASPETIGAGMGGIGGACKACHTTYRMQ